MSTLQDFLGRLAFQPQGFICMDITGASNSVQNALLKFLEETDADVTVYCHISFEPLATIQSRCRVQATVVRPTIERKKELLQRAGRNVTARDVDWDRPLDELMAILSTERGIVDELLAGLTRRDAVATLTASRGFRREETLILQRVLLDHIVGLEKHPAFTSVHNSTLAAWVTLMDQLPTTALAVRWGCLEVLGS